MSIDNKGYITSGPPVIQFYHAANEHDSNKSQEQYFDNQKIKITLTINKIKSL